MLSRNRYKRPPKTKGFLSYGKILTLKWRQMVVLVKPWERVKER